MQRRRLFVAVSAVFLMMSCAKPPKGNDIEADIADFAYQNRPRDLAHYDTTVPFWAGTAGSSIASSDIPWQVPLSCRADYRAWLGGEQSRPIADQADWVRDHCRAPRKNHFVGVAISGGGNKSSVYSAEVLFELQRYGLAEEIDVVSSVSGGSFTAALYGLSCDEASGCNDPDGWRRPRWDYRTIRKLVETDYFWPFVGHRFRPDNLYRNWFQHHGADDDLASIVAARLLRQNGGDITFADLNPARPNLILNATNVTKSRPDFDNNSAIPAADHRPLTDDDALHFAFTQQYFWYLLSDLDSYPLKEAVVASAAFPLIIDRPSLRQYRLPKQDQGVPPKYVALYDGGVHDNFGLTELQWFLQCQLGVPDDLHDASAQFYRSECGAARERPRPDAALVLGIDSSLLRSEGVSDEVPKQRGFDTYVVPIRISGVSEAIDMIMSASGEQRRQQMRRLMRDANPSHAGPGYAAYDSDNPERRSGPFQYLDFDIEAAQVLYCPDQSKYLSRDGTFAGPPPNDELRNAATGGSAKSGCEALQGVLQWNGTTAMGRNLQLPEVLRSFCSPVETCSELEPLIGDRKFMEAYDQGRPNGAADLGKVFFDPNNHDGPRLLRNSLLFDAVQDVPTDFKLAPRYAWLLRYVARWVVADRIWQLCRDNRPLMQVFGSAKAEQVCDKPLPNRPMDDRVGSREYVAAGF